MSATTKLVAVVLAIAAGCTEAPAETPGSDAVRNYFAAVTAKDCSALGTLSGGKVAKNLERLGCDKLIEG
ncbi:MAG TPA: hypothetical protein VFV99_19005, partial [Kofleriaceae bacterium]|nr:hypothetical protein [Kofleriaceae bacterium]